jgi:hypothetical protein
VLIVTHHAPLIQNGVGSAEYWFSEREPAFASDLSRRLIERHDNLVGMLYGHTHFLQNLTWTNGCVIRSNPKGYPGTDKYFVRDAVFYA